MKPATLCFHDLEIAFLISCGVHRSAWYIYIIQYVYLRVLCRRHFGHSWVYIGQNDLYSCIWVLAKMSPAQYMTT